MSFSELKMGLPLLVSAGVIGITTLYFLIKIISKKSPPKLLEDPETKYSVTLIEREEISHDTRRFRFELPSPDHVLGLPVGQHIYLSATINNSLVIRPYTPVSSDDDKGYFDLVIKVYYSNVHPKFPTGGKMSQHLDNMKIGDSIHVRGPSGLLVYKGRGTFAIKPDKKKPEVISSCKRVGFICGGTGITPCLQLIRQVFKDASDSTELWLLYANQTSEDILLRKELEEVEAQHPDRFHLWFTVDRPDKDWKFSSGFVSAEMIENHLPKPDEDTKILICGPPAMVNFACNPNLDKLGYAANTRFAY